MSLSESVESIFRERFGSEPSTVALAPGRVEFIGNHTDYNKGTVIGAAIDRGVCVALKLSDTPGFRFVSSTFPIVEVSDPTKPQVGKTSWVNYPLGVYNALIRRGLKSLPGFEIAVDSDVPSGAGLSSSAALELATAKALSSACGLEISKAQLAEACREAENEFVGVPCGILDQGVSAFGESGRLVHIDCRENDFSTMPIDPSLSIWIFNTHKKHSLVDSMYATRHKECFDAVDALKALGLEIECLADVSPEDFLSKKDSLDENQAKRAEHVVMEIDRVAKVKAYLESGDSKSAGKLLFASHASSRDLFENSVEELDYLVSILESMPEVLGARLTGGGFGGAAMALADEAFTAAYAESVASAYRGKFGEAPEIIRCRIGDGARIIKG